MVLSSCEQHRLLHVHHIELAVESVRISATAFQHRGTVGSRSQTNEDTFLHAPRLIDAMRPQVVLELAVNDASCHQQSQLSETGELVLLCDKRCRIGGRCASREAIGGGHIYNNQFRPLDLRNREE